MTVFVPDSISYQSDIVPISSELYSICIIVVDAAGDDSSYPFNLPMIRSYLLLLLFLLPSDRYCLRGSTTLCKDSYPPLVKH